MRLAAALLVAACRAPHPAPPPAPQTAASATACDPCHGDVVDAWRTSRHAVASTNALFTVSLASADFRGWCLDCHAPLRGAGRGDEGITCAVCHDNGETLLSAGEPSRAATLEHAIVFDPTLVGPELCARCHEFDLPASHPMHSDELVQSTVSEWRASAAAGDGKTCQTCHMGRHGHRFPGAHDPRTARSALTVTARREPAAVELTLTANGVGHRVPTGDPFRRLQVLACADADCSEVLSTRTLGRAYRPDPWTLVHDGTVPADGQVVVRLPVADPRPVHWRVELRYGDPTFEPRLDEADVRLTLHTGTLIAP